MKNDILVHWPSMIVHPPTPYVQFSVLFSNCSVGSEIMAMTQKVLVTAALKHVY